MIMQLDGTDPVTGARFLENEPHVGGWGASRGQDGEHGMIWQASGNFHDMPIEVFESKFPARITDYGFRTDSCGAGEWRGGCGIIREYVLDADDAQLSLWFDRSVTPGWGLFGGLAGAPPRVIINPGAPDEREHLKVSRLPLGRGDVVRCMSGGGGGFGDPLHRDPGSIEEDLADGFISDGYAARHHGRGG
jgi:N-methylhydantoinase B